MVHHRWFIVIGILAALVSSLPALAQTPTDDTPQTQQATEDEAPQAQEKPEAGGVKQPVTYGEIVVTAQKREQNLQDVPMAITAITGADLERIGATTFEEFAIKVPNLSFGTVGDGASDTRSISIRGIFGAGTTGYYIDDTPFEESMAPRVIDVERVEVLRGPQGTLYGARSMGGTVRLITKQPDLGRSEFTGHLLGSSVDEGDWNYQADFAANIPLVRDKLGLRLVGYHQYQSGIFDRVHTDYLGFPTPDFAASENVDDYTVNGAQAALKYQVNDNLFFHARVNYQNLEGNAFPYADYEAGNYVNQRAFDVHEYYEDEWVHMSAGFNATFDAGNLVGVVAHWERDTIDVEDMSELIAWLGFFAGIPEFIPPLETPWPNVDNADSDVAELRFTSTFDGPINFTAGAFYLDTYSSVDHYATSPGFGDAFDVLVGAPPGTDVLGIGDLVYSQDFNTAIEEKAIFGEVTFDFADRWSAVAGARWFDTAIDSDSLIGGFAGVGSIPYDASASEDGITPKFSLQYFQNDDLMFYATASKGYRRGGVNGAPVEFCAADFERFGVDPETAQQVDSDEIWNYELGSKTSFANNRFLLNGAVFYIDWQGIQQLLVLDCGFGFVINSGEAVSKGFELEGMIAASDRLMLSYGVGYTDAHITSPGIVESPISEPGTPVQHVPDWTINASADYNFRLSNSIVAVLRLDYAYVGESISFINHVPGESTPPQVRNPVNLLNLRASAYIDNWEVTLFVDNLLNEITTLGDNRSLAVETPGRPRLSQNRPRTIGVETRFRF
jgi:iron complex outermembrane receptor protein